MKRHLTRKAAISEAGDAIERHQSIINSAREHCFHRNSQKEKFLYTMAVPMLYSAWEGYFKLSLSICLRRICILNKHAEKYSREYITLWLQREKFVASFYRTLLNSIDLGAKQKPVNAGRFAALSEFHGELHQWFKRPVNSLANFDDLVMTYSNVNGDVVNVNAQIIGLDLSGVNFGTLNELVGRRNQISHGGLLDLVEEADADRLANYTRDLLNQFHMAIKTWLGKN